MNANVSVLATLDAEIASLPIIAQMSEYKFKCDPSEAIARLTNARASVAELIEAMQEILSDDVLYAWSNEINIGKDEHRRRVAIIERGRSAITKATGAAA